MRVESLNDPFGGAFDITPDDDNNLTGGNGGATNVYVGASGDLKVTTSLGDTVTFKSIPTGTLLPIRVLKVFSSGTDASEIIGLY